MVHIANMLLDEELDQIAAEKEILARAEAAILFRPYSRSPRQPFQILE